MSDVKQESQIHRQCGSCGRCPCPSATAAVSAIRAYGHIADGAGYSRGREASFTRSSTIPMVWEERSVKPSAKPTLVRTQHLPPPAETARGLGISGHAGRLAVVPLCLMMCRCEPLHSSGYGHMADGIWAGGAVHRTACSSDLDGPPPPPGPGRSPGEPAIWPRMARRIHGQSRETRNLPASLGLHVLRGPFR